MVFKLKSKLMIFTLAISLMISGSIVAVALIKQNSSIQREYSSKAITLASLLSKSLINPIYELQIHLLTGILSGAIEDADVVTAWAIDTDGLIISDGTEANVLQDEATPELFEIMRQASASNIPVDWTRSGELLAVISPILTPNEDLLGFVYLELSLARAHQAVTKQLITLVLLSIVLFLIGIFVAYLAARKLVKPIERMRKTTHRIADGNFDIRLCTESRDELGSLAEDINNMCGQLQQTTVSKNYVNNIIDSMHDSLFVIDDNGLIACTNLALRNLLGYRADELIGKSANFLFSNKVFSDNKIIANPNDIHFKLKSSELIPINLTASRLTKNQDYGSGKFWVVAGAQDIREQKKAAQELQQAVIDSKAAALAKDQFLANMSHEIRTPMNGVIGMAQLMKRTPLTSIQKEYLDIISLSGNNLLAIINDILDISKLDANMTEIASVALNLESICRECVELMAANALEKRLEIYFDYHTDCPQSFLGDPDRLRQIFLNLLSNAIKFTEKGYIRFTVLYKSAVNNGYLLLEVEDTGIGFEEHSQDYLFDAFTQADQNTTRLYGGTGLGLAITKNLVSLMGGEIGASSTLGKGSKFWVKLYLPVTDAPQTLAGKSPRKPGYPFSGSVLVAEDESINQTLVSQCLKNLGLEVEIAADGQQALERWSNQHFDLILMDCRMPVMDGYEVTRQIREQEQHNHYKQIPIVALTADASSDNLNRCELVGMNDVITKPFKLEDLEQCLRKWMPIRRLLSLGLASK